MARRETRGRAGGPAALRAMQAAGGALWAAFVAVLTGALLVSAPEPLVWPRRRRRRWRRRTG